MRSWSLAQHGAVAKRGLARHPPGQVDDPNSLEYLHRSHIFSRCQKIV